MIVPKMAKMIRQQIVAIQIFSFELGSGDGGTIITWIFYLLTRFYPTIFILKVNHLGLTGEAIHGSKVNLKSC